MDERAELARQKREGDRDLFVYNVRILVDYWLKPPGDRGLTPEQRLVSLAYSILSLLDGANPSAGPRYTLKPRGAVDDPDDIGGGELAAAFYSPQGEPE